MAAIFKRRVLKLLIVTLVGSCLVLLVIHQSYPDLNSLPDSSRYFITRQQVFPAIDQVLIHQNCQSINNGSDLKIMIVVSTSPNNFKERKIIRSTYGMFSGSSVIGSPQVRVLFAVGKRSDSSLMRDISRENSQFGDILQFNVTDSYPNLVLKSVAIMKWAASNCKQNMFIIKADDDVYINIPWLISKSGLKVPISDLKVSISDLKASKKVLELDKKLIYGYPGNIHPARSSHSKWYLPLTIYSNKTFPEFVTGLAYIVTSSAARDLYQAAIDTLPWLMYEDVTVTGFAAQKSNIARKFIPAIYLNDVQNFREWPFIDTLYKFFPAKSDLRDKFYFGHYLNEAAFRTIHELILKDNFFTIDHLLDIFKKQAIDLKAT